MSGGEAEPELPAQGLPQRLHGQEIEREREREPRRPPPPRATSAPAVRGWAGPAGSPRRAATPTARPRPLQATPRRPRPLALLGRPARPAFGKGAPAQLQGRRTSAADCRPPPSPHTHTAQKLQTGLSFPARPDVGWPSLSGAEPAALRGLRRRAGETLRLPGGASQEPRGPAGGRAQGASRRLQRLAAAPPSPPAARLHPTNQPLKTVPHVECCSKVKNSREGGKGKRWGETEAKGRKGLGHGAPV